MEKHQGPFVLQAILYSNIFNLLKTKPSYWVDLNSQLIYINEVHEHVTIFFGKIPHCTNLVQKEAKGQG